jgi:hypothetical protein
MAGDTTRLKGDISIRNNKWFLPDTAIITLITGVGLNFFRFLKSLGISGERNLIVLSPRDNFSCDENELKNVRIIVNLKKLNLIKHLDLFLNSLVRILPPNTSLVGYFMDEKSVNVKILNPAKILRSLGKIFKSFGSGTNHIMKRDEVTEILEKNGFKTLTMKEMNGFTYFISQNTGSPV